MIRTEPARLGAALLAVWGVVIACLAWAGVAVPAEVTGAVTILLGIIAGELVRSQVTPIADPHADNGMALVPASPVP